MKPCHPPRLSSFFLPNNVASTSHLSFASTVCVTDFFVIDVVWSRWLIHYNTVCDSSLFLPSTQHHSHLLPIWYLTYLLKLHLLTSLAYLHTYFLTILIYSFSGLLANSSLFFRPSPLFMLPWSSPFHLPKNNKIPLRTNVKKIMDKRTMAKAMEIQNTIPSQPSQPSLPPSQHQNVYQTLIKNMAIECV